MRESGKKSDAMSRCAGVLYNLKRHRFIGWPLLRWLRLVTLAIGIYLVLARVSVWLAATAFALLALSLLLELLLERASYVEFAPSQVPLPRPARMFPEEKVGLRATGHFGVEGKWKTFVDLEAYFRTFNSREHAIMAWVPPSRYMAIGRWPRDELGLWYIFFTHDQILEITPGIVGFSGSRGHGLRIRYVEPAEGKKKSAESTVFLSFSTEQDREKVWADLLWDGVVHLPDEADR